MRPRSHRSTPQRKLLRILRLAQTRQQTACKALLDRLHHDRRIAPLRFAEQQMHVFGHHHISGQHKVVAPPHLLQNLYKQVAVPCTC